MVQIYKDELLHIHQFLIYLMKFLLDNGVSNKFFEELDKEHDNAKEFAKRQKELKEKKDKNN